MAAVLRALEVLEQLAGMEQPAPLRRVSRRVGLSESQTYRVLTELERQGYVDHVGRAGYRLGPRAVALGTLIGPRPALVQSVRPLLARLAVATEQAVALHLRSADARVLVLGLPAPGQPTQDLHAQLGERSSLTVGASGRVILANLPEAEADRIRPRVGRRILAAIRTRGYDVSSAENHPGIGGVSAPLLGEDRVAIGSVTVAGRADRPPFDSPTQPPASLLGPLFWTCRELAPVVSTLLGPDPGAIVVALDL